MSSFRNQLHPSWAAALQGSLELLDEIERDLQNQEFLPSYESVMKAFSRDLAEAKVLIVGQDPYPNPENAMGLAFSIPEGTTKLPATLRNIFKELEDDLKMGSPRSGDLSSWHDQGVVLLNRTLTCKPGESNSHLEIGWRQFTDRCAEILAKQGVVAILWGKNADELSTYFSLDKTISSVHPSPLSAYRGFFGSKPFSRANKILLSEAKSPIKWV
jgi:uracil-DNA glycosylase